MPDDRKEPQSYGSQNDWNSGRTGQEVTDPKSPPPPEQAAFYDSRIEGERSAPHQGGDISPVQVAESDPPVATAGAREIGDEESTAPGVSTEEGGAKRDSYFKRRDYE